MKASEPGPPHSPRAQAFAAQLLHAMRAQRFTPTDLATRIGISPAAVRNYLRASSLPRPGLLAKIEQLLQVRFDMQDSSVVVPKTAALAPAGEEQQPSTSAGLTISAAKTALAANLGVDVSCIEIIVRG